MPAKHHSKPSTAKNDRRRGRPAGKNRTPLSLEERRARNAQYERERRNETATAMAQLAKAACCDTQITNPELLATVICRLQQAANRKPSESIDNIKLINNNLESQIAELQSRLNIDLSADDNSDDQSSSLSDLERSDHKPIKYRKTRKESANHENAIPIRQNSYSSSDTQDSVWSTQLEEDLSDQIPLSLSNIKLESPSMETEESNPYTELRSSSSLSNEYLGLHSDTSNQESALPINQEIKMEFQLFPERDSVLTGDIREMSEIRIDPFTDREKRILENLGCHDFINFDNNNVDEEILRVSEPNWPLDFDDFLAGF